MVGVIQGTGDGPLAKLCVLEHMQPSRKLSLLFNGLSIPVQPCKHCWRWHACMTVHFQAG